MSKENKIFILQMLILGLCALDLYATQYLVTHNIASEGNALMASVIQFGGWKLVSFIKLFVAVTLAAVIPTLLNTRWGRVLVTIVFAVYSILACIHIFLLFFL